MPTKRIPVSRHSRAQLTPTAIERWRRMLMLEEACTCPDPDSAPYPGNVFNSADPAHVARIQLYRIENERYQAKRAACKACPQWQVEHKALLIDLGIKLALWERDIHDRPELIEALDDAGDLAAAG